MELQRFNDDLSLKLKRSQFTTSTSKNTTPQTRTHINLIQNMKSFYECYEVDDDVDVDFDVDDSNDDFESYMDLFKVNFQIIQNIK